jgi:hypothetical protein
MNDEDDSYGYGMMGDMSMGDMSMGNMADFGESGPLENVNPGERIRNLDPGSRVRNAVDTDGDMVDVGQSPSGSLPNNPGPSILGRTPILGSVRRNRDMTVLRDNLPDLMD